MARWRLEYFCLLSIICYASVKAQCSSETVSNVSSSDRIMLNETEYCFVNDCTIRISHSNVLLNIINKTSEWITAANETNLFSVVSSNSSVTNCFREDPEIPPEENFFVFFAVVTFIIITSSSLNTVLHLAVKELRSVSGMIIIGICGTIMIIFLCTIVTAVFQYLHRVNGNSAICAVFKYVITAFTIIYTMLKATYLFHFASLMYKTYTHRLHMEKNKKLLYIYSVFNGVAGIVCTVLVIIIDLLHERTVFAMYNG